jgi:hypothetical protein
MAVNRKSALKASVGEALIQLVEEVPGLSSLIEGFRKYHEDIEDQQRRAFASELMARVHDLEQHADWYSTPEGQEFVRKIIATSLNAEYADKLGFLANALANGPLLANDQARRLKFVEMIRQISRPALDVLALALGKQSSTGEVLPGVIAADMNWDPALVDACISELHSLGALSSVTKWARTNDGYRPDLAFGEGQSATTELTKQFAEFISPPQGA